MTQATATDTDAVSEECPTDEQLVHGVSESGGDPTVQDLVNVLLEHGLTHEEIAASIGRTSVRSIYRWSAGTSRPKNSETVDAISELVDQTLAKRAAEAGTAVPQAELA